MDQIVYMLYGEKSLFEISKELNANFWEVKDFLDKLASKKAIKNFKK